MANPSRHDYDRDQFTYDEGNDRLIRRDDDGCDYSGDGEKIET